MRSSGLLLHITSLPGSYGIGDLGPPARDFVQRLAAAKQTLWQFLPLGPTGYGDSPYQCFSAFAGNPLLVSPDDLREWGLLESAELIAPAHRDAEVDFAAVTQYRAGLMALAWERFSARASSGVKVAWEEFRHRERAWLDDFALYLAMKDHFGGGSWQDWPDDLRCREPAAVARIAGQKRAEAELRCFRQFLFAHQWKTLRTFAEAHGVKMIGDIPIFVALDSSDVWMNPELFKLDAQRRPTVVAGVPPDYFATTGQRWGNPIYDWQRHRGTKFQWWIARLKATFEQVHQVRLDHFRGFEACWEVPADHATAEHGEWVPVPGRELFHEAVKQSGTLPIIAEDLGMITEAVHALRREFGFPGMRILQFAYGGAHEYRFLPHRYEPQTVVYTGTHDNDTTLGWYQSLTPSDLEFFHRYHPPGSESPIWQILRAAWSSVADYVVVPLQDVLELGEEARVNFPGTAEGNWRWRVTRQEYEAIPWDRLRVLTEAYER